MHVALLRTVCHQLHTLHHYRGVIFIFFIIFFHDNFFLLIFFFKRFFCFYRQIYRQIFDQTWRVCVPSCILQDCILVVTFMISIVILNFCLINDTNMQIFSRNSYFFQSAPIFMQKMQSNFGMFVACHKF